MPFPASPCQTFFHRLPAGALLLAALTVVLAGGLLAAEARAASLTAGRTAAEFGVTATGAASYAMPITVAAGRGGLRPDLSLRYHSQSGDGVAGQGFSLGGVSRISRCPLTLAVDGRVQGVRFGASDRFCLDGLALVLVSGTYGGDGAEYRTEVDSLERVRSRGRQGTGPAWFEVQHPDGLTSQYGNGAGSQIPAAGTAGEVSEWAVSRVVDKVGNGMVFSWTTDQASGEPLPTEVRWTTNTAGTGAAFRLRFDYELRPVEDQRSGHRWGSHWQRLKRLAQIRYEHDAGQGFALVHRYELGYAAAAAAGSRRSQLATVQQCGPTTCLPATRFGWQDGSRGFRAGTAGLTDTLAAEALLADHNGDGAVDLYLPITVSGTARWHVRRANPAAGNPLGGSATNTGIVRYGPAVVLDMDGDGRKDLLTVGPGNPGYWLLYRSNGNGGFLPAINTGLSYGEVYSVLPMDMDGDGLDDLVYARNFIVRFRKSTGNGFGPEQTTSISHSGSLAPFLDANSPAPDFDGDGRQDLVILRTNLNFGAPAAYHEGFLSTGSDFESLFTVSTTTVIPMDVNGDGLTDLVYRDATQGLMTRISTGDALAAPVATGIAAGATTIARALDLDGDGREDLMRQLNTTTWRVHLAGGDGSGPVFSNTDPSRYVDLPATPATNQLLRVATTDLNGDGLPDLLFLDVNKRWHSRIHLPGRAALLASAEDGLGNRWQPTYRPLAGFAGYTASGNAAAGERLVRGGPLPVVSAYTATDGGGADYSLSYTYWNARLSRLGRGFLGFERLRATDSRYAALHGVGVYSESVYRQDFPFIGLPSRLTTGRSDNRLVSVVNTIWNAHVRPTAATDAAGDYHFVHAVAEIRDEHETDPDGGAAGELVRRTTSARDFDFNHGQPARETVVITAPGSSRVHTTITTTSFDDALRTGQHCLGLPLRVDVNRDNGSNSATRGIEYSWSPTTCRQISETSPAGGPPDQRLVTTRFWNGAGQLSAVARAAGDNGVSPRWTVYGYSTASDRPVSESAMTLNDGSPTVYFGWNLALEVETSRTSARGLVTRWTHDEFGRVLAEDRPDGADTTWSYLDCGADCFAPAARFQIQVSRSDGFESRTLHDRWGRTVGSESSLAGGNASRQVMVFDALGRLHRETVPYLNGENQYWVTHSYDVAGQKRREDRPAGESGGAATTRWTANRLTLTMHDPEDRATTRTLDPEGRLLTVSSAAGGTASYAWSPFGEVTRITDANGGITTLGYDGRGLPVLVESPDAGRRSSRYNAFGELVSQTDAASPANTISFSYDQLGRLVQRNDAGQGTTAWEFHTASGPLLGLPRRVTSSVSGSPGGFVELYGYDSLGRRTGLTTTVDGVNHLTEYAWDHLGRVTGMVYPAAAFGGRLHLRYRYDQQGFLGGIDQDLSGGGGWWLSLYELRAQDALGRARHVRLGDYSVIDEQREFDRASTRLTAIRTGPAQGSSLQNQAYQWDRAGNLLSRQELNLGVTEEFSYDGVDRLTSARLNGTLTLAVTYDAGGRIRSKSDVGNYSYGASRPGAVTGVAGGPRGTMSFAYDANGSMVMRHGRPITWHPFQLPKRIDHGAGNYSEFAYGPDRTRLRQVTKTDTSTLTTWYVGPHFEVEQAGSSRRFRSTVFANGEAVYSQVEGESPARYDGYFLHRDHLGSVTTLSRMVGTGPQTLAQRFDAFGKRRNANWTADPGDARAGDAHFTERGFGGHEHLDTVRLIHMNGRVQDPVLGTMLSPDPLLGNLLNPQTLNRYSYVANNPLALVDPSGYFFSRVFKFVRRLVSSIASFVRRLVDNWGREIVAAVAGYYTGGLVSSAYTAGAATATSAAAGSTLGAIAGGAVAGGIVTGDVRGVILGGISGGAFSTVGALHGHQWTLGRVVSSGLVGGTLSYTAGGDFGKGFVLAGGAAGLAWGYDRVVGYGPTWDSGGSAQSKQRHDMPNPGANNFGDATQNVRPDSWMKEGGRVSRIMNRVPGMNAIAGMHDVFQVRLDLLGGDRFGTVLRSGLNFPGMPVAAALTYPALMQGAPAVVIAADDP